MAFMKGGANFFRFNDLRYAKGHAEESPKNPVY